MIPLKLELKNFLSYGSDISIIDFSNYSLICFSGKNGHGKSALLDAITWVLWGQARKISGVAKPDLSLLRLGQTEMMVSLFFEISGNIYRVRREFFKLASKSVLTLDLEIFDALNNKFSSLTEKNIRATQEKIESVLGLDFQTFINSAFLRQGLSNEFSLKTPKERKDILANILGLAKYDQLQQKALEKVRNFQDDKKNSLSLIEQTKKELEKEPATNDQKKIIEKNLLDLNLKLEILNKDLNLKELDLQNFFKSKHKYLLILSEIKNIEKQVIDKKNEFKETVLDWKKVFYKSLKLPDINILEKEKEELLIKQKDLILAQQKDLALQESVLQKKEIYQKISMDLKNSFEKDLHEKRFLKEKKEFELKNLNQNLNQKENLLKDNKLKEEKLNKEILFFNKSLENYKSFNLLLEKTKVQFEKRRAFYQVLISKINSVKKDLDENLKLKNLINHNHDNISQCPLCSGDLDAHKKDLLHEKFDQDFKFLNNRYKKLDFLIKKLKEILIKQHEDLTNKVKQEELFKSYLIKKEECLKVLKELDLEKTNLGKDFAEIEKLIIFEQKEFLALTKEESEFALSFEKCIKNNKLLQENLLDIEKLEKERILLNYNKKLYQELNIKLNNLEVIFKSFEQLKQDLFLQDSRKEKTRILNDNIKNLNIIVDQKNLEIKSLNLNLDEEKIIENSLSLLRKDLDLNLKQKENFLQNLGRIESELSRFESLKKEIKEREDNLKIIEKELEEYQILAQAFGKNGIQAILIEEAIPQIEQEANYILGRLTDNQAQIFIESLRDLKSGGVKETLDIAVSDNVGIRSYEMFSGGEAFRVDFALRIAISKLLAHRAGTSLKTLIIDEGFGSQDEEGLNRLMEAIYSIKPDFSKIIVVTHLEQFKENFPVHFLIEKNSTGSFVRVEHRV